MEILVFDVNETLLDLSALDPSFERIFGDNSVRERWFLQLVQSAMVATLTGRYEDFSTLAEGALFHVADRRGVAVSEEQARGLLGQVKRLPLHRDVLPALDSLKTAGYRLAALTNSPYRTLRDQLENSGLAGYFEQALSVDEVRRFKPHPAVYQMAAQRLGQPAANIRLIAAHDWDVVGAVRAGCRAAYVARKGSAIALDEPVDIVGKDLNEVAEILLSR